MRILFCLIFIFSIIESSFAQQIIVKQVEGNVEFVVGDKKTIVKDLSTFSEKSGVFVLKDKYSQLFIRIDDKLDVLYFYEDQYKYPLKELITPKQNLVQKEEGFLDKFFTLFSASNDDNVKINGMLVAEKSGVSRSFNDTNIIFMKPINIMDGYPLKIDFRNFIDNDKIKSNSFNILIKSKNSNRIIFEQTITDTYFTINDTVSNSLFINWDVEIRGTNSSRKIKTTVKSLWISSEKRNLLDKLKDKAIEECETDKSMYQIVFIESLRSIGLLANAYYFLDLFIEINNNPKLINYRKNYVK
tara:strand:- start:5125 stop:6027 length:903 start_codon:yes stop_codon:yes gene_type:complete